MTAEKATIVYFHGNDWSGVPGRQRLLMEAMAQYVRVVFLDGGRDRRWRISASEPASNVVVVRGLASLLIALSRRGWHLPARLLARRALRKHLGPGDRVIYWGAENYYQLHRYVRHDFFVHDSIDPCLLPGQERAFAEREQAVAREANAVFCTAETLLAEARKANGNCHLLPNACAASDFESGGRWTDLPAELAGRKGPFVGYIGTLDQRLALPHLLRAATALERLTFVLVGPVLKEVEEQLKPLRELPNVVFTGPKFWREATAFAQAFDVCLIPFAAGKVGDALNPVKLYTYLAGRKSVVATAIHECQRHDGLVRVAETPEEFCRSIEQAIAFPDTQMRQRGVDFARDNMWEHRAAHAMTVLRASGAFGDADGRQRAERRFVREILPAMRGQANTVNP